MSDAPEEIHGVSTSIFSVARHYGGCTLNGHRYVYDPTRDVLIRADVLRRRAAEAADARRAQRERAAEAQGALPLGAPTAGPEKSRSGGGT